MIVSTQVKTTYSAFMNLVIKDAKATHWVYRAPKALRPFLQLSRYDRPIGYWLLALPGWIGLAFGSLTYGISVTDIKWAMLILIGAIAMRGAGCTYNDIIDRDLDAQVERTALRPLPSGVISPRQAWMWLVVQCMVGLIVLLCLPRAAQLISLLSIPLVAAYPFMKRITWWPQLWLGLTFNWAVLVAYVIKADGVSGPLLLLYAGLIFWTVGYDTIYACQDIEDDAFAGIKSTARRFGAHVKLGVGVSYGVFLILSSLAWMLEAGRASLHARSGEGLSQIYGSVLLHPLSYGFVILPALHLYWQVRRMDISDPQRNLALFKSNFWQAMIWIVSSLWFHFLIVSSV